MKDLVRLMAAASGRARALGHDMSDWEPGVGRRHRVSRCRSCGLYAVVSTAPDEEPFIGSTLEVMCEGAGTLPAWHIKRRSTALV